MPTRVDDRTQVLLVSLRTEARLLETWLQHRSRAAHRRTQAPRDALAHRLTLLQRNVPRLEEDVARLERAASRTAHPEVPLSGFLRGVGRGVLVAVAALAWVVGVVAVTPDARTDDPLRLVAGLCAVLVVAVARRSGR